MTTDIAITDESFAATTATITAITDAGKAFMASIFGIGAVSAELPKSKAIEFAEFAAKRSVVVA